MEYFRFTLFNNITLLIVALTLAVAGSRWLGRSRSNWSLIYYIVLVGYTLGFDGSLNKWWVGGGVACGLAVRMTGSPIMACVEAIFFSYVICRAVGLLLMW